MEQVCYIFYYPTSGCNAAALRTDAVIGFVAARGVQRTLVVVFSLFNLSRYYADVVTFPRRFCV